MTTVSLCNIQFQVSDYIHQETRVFAPSGKGEM